MRMRKMVKEVEGNTHGEWQKYTYRMIKIYMKIIKNIHTRDWKYAKIKMRSKFKISSQLSGSIR